MKTEKIKIKLKAKIEDWSESIENEAVRKRESKTIDKSILKIKIKLKDLYPYCYDFEKWFIEKFPKKRCIFKEFLEVKPSVEYFCEIMHTGNCSIDAVYDVFLDHHKKSEDIMFFIQNVTNWIGNKISYEKVVASFLSRKPTFEQILCLAKQGRSDFYNRFSIFEYLKTLNLPHENVFELLKFGDRSAFYRYVLEYYKSLNPPVEDITYLILFKMLNE